MGQIWSARNPYDRNPSDRCNQYETVCHQAWPPILQTPFIASENVAVKLLGRLPHRLDGRRSRGGD